jgi:hypothetical protein
MLPSQAEGKHGPGEEKRVTIAPRAREMRDFAANFYRKSKP